MKGLTMHCKKVESKDTGKTRKHSEVKDKIMKNLPQKYQDVLLILTCIEKGDNSDVFDKAVERITHINKTFTQEKPIVVLPFAHLSKQSATG